MNEALTIWKLPGATLPEEGLSSNFNSLSLSFFPTGSRMFSAQSQFTSFSFKNLRVIVFLWPQSTFWKSTIASGLPSIIIYGTVRLLKMSSLYFAPFFTYKTIEFFILLHGVFFLVAKVTVTLAYSPGANLTLSGVIL